MITRCIFWEPWMSVSEICAHPGGTCRKHICPADGTGQTVRRSFKSWGYILWGPRLSLWNFIDIHFRVVELFVSGPVGQRASEEREERERPGPFVSPSCFSSHRLVVLVKTTSDTLAVCSCSEPHTVLSHQSQPPSVSATYLSAFSTLCRCVHSLNALMAFQKRANKSNFHKWSVAH